MRCPCGCVPSDDALSYCLNFLVFKSGTILSILVLSTSKETFLFFCYLTMCYMSGTQKYQMKQITLWMHDKWHHQETVLCFSTFWKPSLKHWHTLWRGAKVLSVLQGCHEIQVWQYTQKHFISINYYIEINIVISQIPRWLSGKESACQCMRHKRSGFGPWVKKIPWRRKCKPFQYSCWENPRDRGACWATVHGVAESDTTE